MKTHVIQLERHDDVTSVSDKIAWSKASRVLLVWPRRGRVMNRPLDLVLIQRACQGMGAQLACVADDDDVLDHAKELGIPVFHSVKVAERLAWRRTRRKKIFEPQVYQPLAKIEELRHAAHPAGWQWTENKWVRLGAFLVGLVAVVALFVVLLPEAKIVLPLEVSQQSVDLSVWASPDLPTVNLSGGLPAVPVSILVKGRASGNTTGSTLIPESAASGRVQFTNLTDQVVIIPPGTIVQTQAEPVVQFQTTREVSLGGKPGEIVDCPVTAIQAGSRGNLYAGTLRAIIGPLGARIAVNNADILNGGRDLASRTAAKEDIDLLREELAQSLKGEALQQIREELEPGSRLLEASLRLVKIQDETLEPPAGLPAEQVILTVQAEYQAWTIHERDLALIGRTVLDADRPEGTMSLAESFQNSDLSVPELKDGLVRWQIRVSQLVQATWDNQTIIQAAAGRTILDAQISLARLPGLVAQPEIEISPAWWPIIPLLPGRIQVEVR